MSETNAQLWPRFAVGHISAHALPAFFLSLALSRALALPVLHGTTRQLRDRNIHIGYILKGGGGEVGIETIGETKINKHFARTHERVSLISHGLLT